MRLLSLRVGGAGVVRLDQPVDVLRAEAAVRVLELAPHEDEPTRGSAGALRESFLDCLNARLILLGNVDAHGVDLFNVHGELMHDGRHALDVVEVVVADQDLRQQRLRRYRDCVRGCVLNPGLPALFLYFNLFLFPSRLRFL